METQIVVAQVMGIILHVHQAQVTVVVLQVLLAQEVVDMGSK